MVLPFDPNLIPRTRRGAECLIESAGGNLSLLNDAQLLAIKELYRLDDDRTVEQLIKDGEVLP
jgi:hypothetical protein